MDVLDFPLSRLCYAAHPEDASEIESAGFPAWLDRQLDPGSASSNELDGRLRSFKLQIKYAAGDGKPAPNGLLHDWPAVDDMRQFQYLDAPIETVWAWLDPKVTLPVEEMLRAYEEVATATILRAVHSRAQLFERMTGFWHDHFSVLATEDLRIGCSLPSYDRDAIRAHALGNFRELLEAVAVSPAMLIYLSNGSSRAGAANENYARELLELHTLGRDAYLNERYRRWRDVPGATEGKPAGYIDEDVYESARAFTGWTVENGQWLDSAAQLPLSGKFTYIETWHDGNQKRVLGNELAPFGAPMADGRKVLDLAAFHPATARFLCLQLCQYFVSDSPPVSLVNSAAKLWLDNAKKSNQIAIVTKHIALSKAFAASRAAKPRSPLALAASFARITGIDLVPTMPLVEQLAKCGQRLFGWPTPDGRPSGADYYLTPDYLRKRWFLIAGLAENAWNNGEPKALAVSARPDLPRVSDAVRYWLPRFAGPRASPALFLAALGEDMAQARCDQKTLAWIAGICAAAPQFQIT